MGSVRWSQLPNVALRCRHGGTDPPPSRRSGTQPPAGSASARAPRSRAHRREPTSLGGQGGPLHDLPASNRPAPSVLNRLMAATPTGPTRRFIMQVVVSVVFAAAGFAVLLFHLGDDP